MSRLIVLDGRTDGQAGRQAYLELRTRLTWPPIASAVQMPPLQQPTWLWRSEDQLLFGPDPVESRRRPSWAIYAPKMPSPFVFKGKNHNSAQLSQYPNSTHRPKQVFNSNTPQATKATQKNKELAPPPTPKTCKRMRPQVDPKCIQDDPKCAASGNHSGLTTSLSTTRFKEMADATIPQMPRDRPSEQQPA